MKQVPLNVRQVIAKTVEKLIEENKELDIFKIVYILENEYGIRFYNLEILQGLIKKSLDEIVFIYV
ncbi:Uncharacterised protein [uncultured Clostridium sp.]|uniref:hypothetical protein n=1 Tax=uncultured Clostridium sp. TaxID=59620 RepID=UPI000820333B|nr:hypothetical protein [uncultured Clostridium sp.]SCJ08552.1 Uncharacterised protein [uncultured Clostridium sp.]